MKKLYFSFLAAFLFAANGLLQAQCEVAKTIPYSENFNSIITVDATSEGNLPSCWNSFTNNATYPAPHVIENGMYSGNMGTMTSNALLFVNTSGNRSFAVLPELNTAYNLLQISFYVKWQRTIDQAFVLGYVTDASDFATTNATFNDLKTIPTSANNTVFTENLSSYAIPPDARLAFRFFNYSPTTPYGVIIDDINRRYKYRCDSALPSTANSA